MPVRTTPGSGAQTRNGDGIVSNCLFIPEGDNTAHNLMNFGNYLWAATGEIAGFNLDMLKLGAQLNSLLNPRANGYSPQFDSSDDQLSIQLGYYHAKNNGYKKK